MINLFINFKQPPPVSQEKQEFKEIKEAKQPVKEALSEEELMKKTIALIDEYINVLDLKVFWCFNRWTLYNCVVVIDGHCIFYYWTLHIYLYIFVKILFLPMIFAKTEFPPSNASILFQ